MKKLGLFFAVIILTIQVQAQDADPATDAPKEGWSSAGNFALLFNQAAFNSEWQGGGVTNISGNLSLSYDINYRMNGISWDTKLLADYGASKIKSEDNIQKTNDRLEILSVIGKQIGQTNWFYSGMLNFKTQFDSGFEETEEEVDLGTGQTITITNRDRNTKFLSPAYLLVGPGILWKKTDNLKVNFAPATAKFIFVDSQFTDPTDPRNRLDDNNSYFGVDANETMKFELGFAVNGYAKFDLMTNISMENILSLYSNYLEDPQNVDIDYTANINMKINGYISANVAFQAIYDDNAVQGFQIREALGIGLTYKFK
jgi:Protein of unknown function (DUF3078)